MLKILLVVPAAMLLASGTARAQTFRGAVSDTDLGTIAGKADIANNVVTARNNAVVANNTITGVSTTGGVTIDGSAFQNINGLAVISANTGNNVVINSSLNVNVTIRQ